MRKSAKLILTAATAALVLAAALSTASARNLSVSNQNIRATWARLEFVSTVTVRCPVTLEGSFHTRTIAKVARSLIGAVTAAIVNQAGCSGGIGAAFNGREPYNGTTSPNTLPWHITYERFAGTLPNITSVTILLQRFRFGICATIFGSTTCGQYGTESDNISANANREPGGAITSLAPVTAGGLNRASLFRCDRPGIAGCPTEGRMVGPEGAVTVLGSTTRISITLI